MRKPILLPALALAAILTPGMHAQDSDPSSLVLDLFAGEANLMQSMTDPLAMCVREGNPGPGLEHSPRPGSPDLGMRAVDVLLPYTAQFDRMRIRVIKDVLTPVTFLPIGAVGVPSTIEVSDPGTTLLAIPEGVQLDALGRDVEIYASDGFWPLRGVDIIGAAQQRALRSVRLAFRPFVWDPSTGQLMKREHLRIRISWKGRQVSRAETRRDLRDPVYLSDHDVDQYINGDMAPAWYPDAGRRKSAADYVIITTAAIKANSAELPRFIALKASQGHKVITKTVEDIDGSYGFKDRSDGIRAYLRATAMRYGIRNVLLIGDPDPLNLDAGKSDFVGSVPMKMIWPGGAGKASPTAARSCATDAYFAELSEETWDLDGDGRAGELKGDGISFRWVHTNGWIKNELVNHLYPSDFSQELNVARIPFDNIETVDEFLEATIDYQTTTQVIELMHRCKVHLAMAESNKGSAVDELGRNIDASLAANPWVFFTNSLFQRTPFDYLLKSKTLPKLWSDPSKLGSAGLVVFTGFGDTVSSQLEVDGFDGFGVVFQPLISILDVAGLDSTTRSIITQACSWNANPETKSNLTHSFLQKISVGGYACTGRAWNAPPRTGSALGTGAFLEDLAYNTSAALANRESMGGALTLHRRHIGDTVVSTVGSIQVLYGMNAYGDPAGEWKVDPAQ